MPQAGFEPQVKSPAFYEASALHPSHHGWVTKKSSRDIKNLDIMSIYILSFSSLTISIFIKQGPS